MVMDINPTLAFKMNDDLQLISLVIWILPSTCRMLKQARCLPNPVKTGAYSIMNDLEKSFDQIAEILSSLGLRKS